MKHILLQRHSYFVFFFGFSFCSIEDCRNGEYENTFSKYSTKVKDLACIPIIKDTNTYYECDVFPKSKKDQEKFLKLSRGLLKENTFIFTNSSDLKNLNNTNKIISTYFPSDNIQYELRLNYTLNDLTLLSTKKFCSYKLLEQYIIYYLMFSFNVSSPKFPDIEENNKTICFNIDIIDDLKGLVEPGYARIGMNEKKENGDETIMNIPTCSYVPTDSLTKNLEFPLIFRHYYTIANISSYVMYIKTNYQDKKRRLNDFDNFENFDNFYMEINKNGKKFEIDIGNYDIKRISKKRKSNSIILKIRKIYTLFLFLLYLF